MAVEIVFTGYYRAQIAIFGNALSIGSGGGSYIGDSFSTLSNTRTIDYTLNGANTTFNMPAGYKVLFAEMQIATIGTMDSNPILSTPTEVITIPNASFSTYPGSTTVKYLNVTSIIQNGGSGIYSIENVQGSEAMMLWSIFVIFEHQSFDINYVYYARDNTIISGTTTTVFNNVYTPTTGTVTGYVVRTAAASDTVDNTTFRVNGVLMGNTSNPWDGLQPYNPATDALPGIICNANTYEPSLFSLLETRATFGTANINPYSNTRPNPCRAYVDIAGFDVSSALSNGQSTMTFTEAGPGGGFYTLMTGVQINSQVPIVHPVKSSNRSVTYNGDVVTYTIVLTNTGNFDATNLYLIDTLPSQILFINDSIFVDGVIQPGATLNSPGISLGTLPINDTRTIVFSVSIVNGILGTTINNACNAIYGTSPAVFSSMSNTVPMNIVNIGLTSKKYVDKTYASLGDTISYTIYFNPLSVSVIDTVTIVDDLPTGLIYTPNTLFVNGVANGGSLSTPGLVLTSLPANTANTITFIVSVVSLPASITAINSTSIAATTNGLTLTSNTNIVTTTILGISISNTKSVDKAFTSLGDTLTYTISLSNTGNTNAYNIRFIDTIPSSTQLISGSFKQDGISIITSPNPPGVILPLSIPPNGISTITFMVNVITIPNPTSIVNRSYINASFVGDSGILPNDEKNVSVDSNSTLTQFQMVDFTGIRKYVDLANAKPNTTLTYTIVIPNTGNLASINSVLFDTIPNGTTFVTGSVTLDGVTISDANPQVGINLGSIMAQTVHTIEFKVYIN
ncbi:MAG: hypothetical protein ACRC7N_02220 [Clostridium sp.]